MTFQEFGQPPAGPVARATYKLVVCFDASQYQANALRCHELHPLGFVLWVARRKVQRPVNSRRLSIPIVHDVVDMTYQRLELDIQGPGREVSTLHIRQQLSVYTYWGHPTMLSCTRSLTSAIVHNFVRQDPNHFTPYHLLPVETPPLPACKKTLATSYKFSPCKTHKKLVLRHDMNHLCHNSQSTAVSCNIKPASSICAGFIPKLIHLPMRVRTSESHLGLSAAVAGASMSDVGQLLVFLDAPALPLPKCNARCLNNCVVSGLRHFTSFNMPNNPSHRSVLRTLTASKNRHPIYVPLEVD